MAIGGAANYEALMRFAENSLQSCLSMSEPPVLERLAGAALAALRHGEGLGSSPALRALSDYLNRLDEACYVLKNRMENLRLRHDLLPWVEALDDWLWVGKHAVRLLEAINNGKSYDKLIGGVKRAVEEVQAHSKRTSGNALQPFAHGVLEYAEQARLRAASRREHVPSTCGLESYRDNLAA